MSIYTSSYCFHPVCGRFQVSVVCLWSVCGDQTSDSVNLNFLLSFPPCLWSFSGVCGAQTLNYVNLHFLLSFPPCLWSFSGVCSLSVVPKHQILSIYTTSYRFHPVCGRFQVSVVCLSVVTKLQILSIYTSSYRFHPVCGRFQVSVVCLWSVCGAQSSKYDNLHYLL
jgi:hypothetical protein